MNKPSLIRTTSSPKSGSIRLEHTSETGGTFGMFGFTDAVSEFDAADLNILDAQALLLDSAYQPKHAYDAIATYIESK